MLGSIDDPVRKMKWQQIQGEVAQEYDVVKNIMQTLNTFKVLTYIISKQFTNAITGRPS